MLKFQVDRAAINFCKSFNFTFEVEIQLLERLPTDPTPGGNERPATPVQHIEILSDSVIKFK